MGERVNNFHFQFHHQKLTVVLAFDVDTVAVAQIVAVVAADV